MRYGLFYHYQLLGDVLLIDLLPELPNHQEVRGRVHVLYAGDKIVGYNIFAISEIVKIKAKGLIVLPSKPLIDVINSLLVAEHLQALPLIEDSGFCVGKILSVEPHPQSEHLHITTVDVGNEILTIVCGAANCQSGLVVLVARPGAIMFDGTRIIPTELLGVASSGMLCSSRELAISDQAGLLVLDCDLKLGSDFFLLGGN